LLSNLGVKVRIRKIFTVYWSKQTTLALEARLVEYHGVQIFRVDGRCGQVEKVGENGGKRLFVFHGFCTRLRSNFLAVHQL
jgi:hypothetical protein